MSDEHNTVLLPRIESRIQVIRGFKAEVVANCGLLRNLTAPPERGRRSIGFLTHEDTKTPKVSSLTKERSRERPTKTSTSTPFMTMAFVRKIFH